MDKKLRKNNRKIVFALVLIFGLSIGYAVISNTLNINGKGNFGSNSWNIYFDNINVLEGEDLEAVKPTTTGTNTTSLSYKVNFNVPGDTYKFKVDVVNNGTLDAMVSLKTDTISNSNFNNFAEYKVTYSDGVEIGEKNLLKANTSDSFLVSVTYKEVFSVDELLTSNEDVTFKLDLTYEYADETGVDREHLEDTQGPVIKFSKIDDATLSNGWSSALKVKVNVTDASGIKEVKYCTGVSACTPNTAATLTDNSFEYTFNPKSEAQQICVSAIDDGNNTTTKCSTETYLVDNDVPTMTSVNVVPDDDTMRVEIVGATDSSSGVEIYYYSKDAGANYIKSANSNYTFTNLDEGDYLVTAYVEDSAGHTSEMKSAQTTIRHKSWCEKNGITNFGDCVIASEAKNTNIAQAKATISAKGTPDFTVTAPAIEYSEVHASNTSSYETRIDQNIGTGYTFNPTTGYYALTGASIKNPTTIDYSKREYFTCNGIGTRCTTMYKITSVTTSIISNDTTIYKITKYNYTSAVKSYDNSGSGMYATNDDEGTSYYYRGAVSGNYVKFAGKYWRIIRVNGDGSVRLIYDGTSAHSNGETSSNRQVATTYFNTRWNDNAYVGYMYGDTSTNVVTEYDVIYNQGGLSSTTKYWFGTEYVPNGAAKNTFSVGGTKYQLTLEEYKASHSDDKLYTCFSTSETGACQQISHVQKYVSPTSMNVKSVEYGSVSKESAQTNLKHSTVKEYLDSWYTSNLQSYTSKLATNASFCGDRGISTHAAGAYKNFGYMATPTVYGYERFYSWDGPPKGPRLTCSSVNDKYTVKSASTGNKALTNSIGLITADEINMAGGLTNSKNSLYYLYSGTKCWTMSPSLFYYQGYACIFYMQNDGSMAHGRTLTNLGVRPVINIKSEDLTFTGSGTKEDPYTIL